MNPCPKCQQRPISMSEWIKGANAFSCYCAACSAPLKANKMTRVCFVLTLVITALTLYLALELLELPSGRRGMAFLVGLAPLVLGGIIGYAVSGYELEFPTREEPPSES